MITLSPSDLERFWRKVKISDDPDACWEWQAAHLKTGYGTFRLQSKTKLAHRVAYLIHHGHLPDDLFVCHSCDNRSCVRPGHLFPGTAADNIRDRDVKGRTAREEKHGLARLTVDQVVSIRQRHEAGETQLALAAEFGFTHTGIGMIVRGENWKNVGGPVRGKRTWLK